ncbi:hypothetical protein F4802DRAFT_119916 [Xylaria palmicola]|nr:hypothetical protein F4802DRAFT_119916 [Xylaria palmicola]
MAEDVSRCSSTPARRVHNARPSFAQALSRDRLVGSWSGREIELSGYRMHTPFHVGFLFLLASSVGGAYFYGTQTVPKQTDIHPANPTAAATCGTLRCLIDRPKRAEPTPPWDSRGVVRLGTVVQRTGALVAGQHGTLGNFSELQESFTPRLLLCLDL